MSKVAKEAFGIFQEHALHSYVIDKATWQWRIARVHDELTEYFENEYEDQSDYYDAHPVALSCYMCGKRGPVDEKYEMCDACYSIQEEIKEYAEYEDYISDEYECGTYDQIVYEDMYDYKDRFEQGYGLRLDWF